MSLVLKYTPVILAAFAVAIVGLEALFGLLGSAICVVFAAASSAAQEIITGEHDDETMILMIHNAVFAVIVAGTIISYAFTALVGRMSIRQFSTGAHMDRSGSANSEEEEIEKHRHFHAEEATTATALFSFKGTASGITTTTITTAVLSFGRRIGQCLKTCLKFALAFGSLSAVAWVCFNCMINPRFAQIVATLASFVPELLVFWGQFFCQLFYAYIAMIGSALLILVVPVAAFLVPNLPWIALAVVVLAMLLWMAKKMLKLIFSVVYCMGHICLCLLTVAVATAYFGAQLEDSESFQPSNNSGCSGRRNTAFDTLVNSLANTVEVPRQFAAYCTKVIKSFFSWIWCFCKIAAVIAFTGVWAFLAACDAYPEYMKTVAEFMDSSINAYIIDAASPDHPTYWSPAHIVALMLWIGLEGTCRAANFVVLQMTPSIPVVHIVIGFVVLVGLLACIIETVSSMFRGSNNNNHNNSSNTQRKYKYNHWKTRQKYSQQQPTSSRFYPTGVFVLDDDPVAASFVKNVSISFQNKSIQWNMGATSMRFVDYRGTHEAAEKFARIQEIDKAVDDARKDLFKVRRRTNNNVMKEYSRTAEECAADKAQVDEYLRNFKAQTKLQQAVPAAAAALEPITQTRQPAIEDIGKNNNITQQSAAEGIVDANPVVTKQPAQEKESEHKKEMVETQAAVEDEMIEPAIVVEYSEQLVVTQMVHSSEDNTQQTMQPTPTEQQTEQPKIVAATVTAANVAAPIPVVHKEVPSLKVLNLELPGGPTLSGRKFYDFPWPSKMNLQFSGTKRQMADQQPAGEEEYSTRSSKRRRVMPGLTQEDAVRVNSKEEEVPQLALVPYVSRAIVPYEPRDLVVAEDTQEETNEDNKEEEQLALVVYVSRALVPVEHAIIPYGDDSLALVPVVEADVDTADDEAWDDQFGGQDDDDDVGPVDEEMEEAIVEVRDDVEDDDDAEEMEEVRIEAPNPTPAPILRRSARLAAKRASQQQESETRDGNVGGYDVEIAAAAEGEEQQPIRRRRSPRLIGKPRLNYKV